MSSGKAIIKWPGGKAREIRYVSDLIPEFDRYVEPFFGGGAMFFHLKPKKAVINDLSPDLIRFYRLVQVQDAEFELCLRAFDHGFQQLLSACGNRIEEILALYTQLSRDFISSEECLQLLLTLSKELASETVRDLTVNLIPDPDAFVIRLSTSALGKMRRTIRNSSTVPFREADLGENLITGFAGGYYLYFRDIYNRSSRTPGAASDAFLASVFYFIREYCYGSMFRCNSEGEFNIPYGGMSYNRKALSAKIDRIFSHETQDLFSDTEICCSDFADFIETQNLTERDFMFLDPPYDSDFSDYDGRAFTREDQKRLADLVRKTNARFILIIKNTDFIRSLYEGSFRIIRFDKTYAYNIRQRNDRHVEHLIVTNLDERLPHNPFTP